MQTPIELLNVRQLVKHFGGLCVTDHVNLTVNAGEIHALIGPNGAGKTTLINQICGSLDSDAGQIFFQGKDISRWHMARRARAGMSRSYQINALIPAFTARENVLLAVQAARGHNFYFFRPVMQQTDLIEQADFFLDRVGVLSEANALVGALSYGQQRLIEVAMAMATEPKLLLLDEPMAGLGPAETERMVHLLSGLRKNYAMLLVEHDMAAVFALADRISVLVYGQVLLCDTPQNVRHSELVREAYLGDEDI
jgi:branched-chain amino acid transport system ATP-binding protein